MQSDPSSAWPSAVANADDEFASFLEYPDLELDFQAFENQQTEAQVIPQDLAAQDGLKQSYDTTEYYDQIRHAALPKPDSTGDLRGRMTGMQMTPNGRPAQHGYNHAMQYQNGRIPPTPSSSELHASHQPRLLVDAQQAAIYEAHMRKQQEQMMAFTPLGTPAVTPMMDTQFQIRDYAVPGEYFSPLASPALHAQSRSSDGGSMYYPFHMSDASETTSPVDTSLDLNLKPTSAPRKQQKRKSPTSNAAKAASPKVVRQSPAMKAQRKKTSSTVIPAKEINEVLAASRPGTAGSNPQSLGLPPTNMSSESPEPLLDMMPPPAIPSSRKSPFMKPESQSTAATPARANAPATPTTLLKMKNVGTLQDLNLGAAALENEDVAMTDDTTSPTIAVMPVAAFNQSAISMSPPSSAATPKFKGKAAEFKAPLKSKKRNSSSHVSPALRPKISPSIKPLLPEGILNAETSVLLLASKSNYQNILDGTHLPGVTYPEALSENLTSKRTSHKIAEQGRRNRINTALQEIAALLPQGANGKAADSGPASAQSSSKASTVEQAIDYIKQLQAEIQDVKAKLAVSESKLQVAEATAGGPISGGETASTTHSNSPGEQMSTPDGPE